MRIKKKRINPGSRGEFKKMKMETKTKRKVKILFYTWQLKSNKLPFFIKLIKFNKNIR